MYNSICNLLSSIWSDLFDLTPPCEIKNEFYSSCGHTVTSRRCRNPARFQQGDDDNNNNNNQQHHRQDPEAICDARCRKARTLPTIIHMHTACLWCNESTLARTTRSIRSDLEHDAIAPAELLRRQEAHQRARDRRMPARSRLTFHDLATRRAQWAARCREEDVRQDARDLAWQVRVYHIGGGFADRRLMRPLQVGEIPGDGGGGGSSGGGGSGSEDEECGICKSSLRDGAAIVLPCHETHRMHGDCIEHWFLTYPGYESCPMCRARFRVVGFEMWWQSFGKYNGCFSDMPLSPPASLQGGEQGEGEGEEGEQGEQGEQGEEEE